MPMNSRSLESRFATTKVLVVDDEPYMRKVVRTLLESIGIQTVEEAGTASTGLDLIRRKSPHVVILDWEMPGIDGAGFMRLLRSPGVAHADVPVIMLSGHSERRRVVEAMQLGVNEFLLANGSDGEIRPEQDAARRCGALVDGQKIGRHIKKTPLFGRGVSWG